MPVKRNFTISVCFYLTQLLSFVQNPGDYVVIQRFLGTTRASSNITSCLMSITDQLDILFSFDFDRLAPTKTLSELKSYLLKQFIKIKSKFPEKKIVVFLDSIDQLVSFDNSTTLHDVSWILKEFPDNVKMIYSTIPYFGGILKSIKDNGITEAENFLKITRLDKEISLAIMEGWLKSNNRLLTPTQMNTIESIFEKTALYPLYIKLIFDIACKWPSYYTPTESFYECLNIDQCITYLFKFFEDRHGKVLFSRCCLYLSLFSNGISENELEDILSNADLNISSFIFFGYVDRLKLCKILISDLNQIIIFY